MKKISPFLTVLVFVAFSSTLKAQSATANVTADVFAQLTIAKVAGADVNFGGVAQTTSPVLDPNNINNSTDVGASSTLGEFEVEGSAGTNNVIVTYDNSVTLTGGTGTDLVFTPDIVGDANNGGTAADQSSAASVTNGGSISLGDGNDGGGVGNAPNFYLWLGGSLVTQGQTSVTTASSGSFSGTFNISVAYN